LTTILVAANQWTSRAFGPAALLPIGKMAWRAAELRYIIIFSGFAENDFRQNFKVSFRGAFRGIKSVFLIIWLLRLTGCEDC
jgi:hypothetical protein